MRAAWRELLRTPLLGRWMNREPGSLSPARLRLAGTFLTAAVTAALVARQPAAFADAIILHSFSLPSPLQLPSTHRSSRPHSNDRWAARPPTAQRPAPDSRGGSGGRPIAQPSCAPPP